MPATELGHIISPLFRFSGLFFGPFLYIKRHKKVEFFIACIQMQPKAQPISFTVAPKNKKGIKTLLYVTLLLANSINISAYGIGSRIFVDIFSCLSLNTFAL